LSGETLVVPAQAVLDAELARDLPTVLRIQRPGAFPALRSGRVRNAGAVYRAEQKTGVLQSNVSARYCLPLGVGQTRLRVAAIVHAGRRGADAVGEGVDAPLPSNLEAMTSADQHAAQDGRRLVQDHGIKCGD